MASGSCGDNATWELNESTWVLTVSGTGAIANHCGGTAVASNPLRSYASSIKKIVINGGITSLGLRCFYNMSATTDVKLPSTLTTIGDGAFQNCTSLTSITIPDNVTTIGTSIGVGITIGRSFAGCKALKTIIIGSSVSSIKPGAFYECKSVKEIYFRGNQPTFDGATTIDSVRPFELSPTSTVTATVYTTGWGSDSVFSDAMGEYTTFNYMTWVPPNGPNIHVNVGGTWKSSKPYVNVGGTWKEVVGVYANVGGTWKEVK